MWYIIKSAAIRKVKNENMHLLKIERNTTNVYQVISDAFNNYLLSVAKKITINKNNSDPTYYLLLNFNNYFTNMKFHHTST